MVKAQYFLFLATMVGILEIRIKLFGYH